MTTFPLYWERLCSLPSMSLTAKFSGLPCAGATAVVGAFTTSGGNEGRSTVAPHSATNPAAASIVRIFMMLSPWLDARQKCRAGAIVWEMSMQVLHAGRLAGLWDLFHNVAGAGCDRVDFLQVGSRHPVLARASH